MDWRTRIEINPAVLVGKPVVRGTRISVEQVLLFMGNGWTEEQMLENFPRLTREDIRACWAYAADAVC
mgnify:CR=1 FL=1|jgi:uncharacterized protein (DUF433 family)